MPTSKVGLDFSAAAEDALGEETANSETEDAALGQESTEGASDVIEQPNANGVLGGLNANDGENEQSLGNSFIEVDGERVSVDQVRSWKQGNMRQEDYTKKTQELAAQRQQAQDALDLWDAMEKDPMGTVKKLYARFQRSGVTPRTALESFEGKPKDTKEDLDEMINQRVKEALDSDPRIKAYEERQAQEALDKVWAEIESEYGVKLTNQDKYTVLTEAESRQNYDLPYVFHSLYKRVQGDNAQKRNIRDVSSAGGTRGGDTPTYEPVEVNTFADAVRNATAELEYSI